MLGEQQGGDAARARVSNEKIPDEEIPDENNGTEIGVERIRIGTEFGIEELGIGREIRLAEDAQDESKVPTTGNVDFGSPNFTSDAGIFGRDMDIAIDNTRSLRSLGVSRYGVVAKVHVFETDTALPAPVITAS